METIVIGEKARNSRMASLVVKLLSRFGKVICADTAKIFGKNDADYLVIGSKELTEISLERGIFVVERGFSGKKLENLERVIPVIGFDDSRAAALLNGTSVPTVTVGTSGKATLSMASFSRDKAEISLQRCIFSLSGEKIEPCDFAVKHAGMLSLEEILMLSAVCLLLDIPFGYNFSDL